MRYFIAVPLPDRVCDNLVQWQGSMPDGIRKVLPDQMHITLRFLGNVSQEMIQPLRNTLTEVTEELFEVGIHGTGSFPFEGKPKVLWADVGKVSPLMRVQKKVESICIDAGFEPSEQSYVPHITLGRVKQAVNHDVKVWLARNMETPAVTLKVNRFNLYKSRQTDSGVVHQVVETYKLNR